MERKYIYRPILRPVSRTTLPDGVNWDYISKPTSFQINRPDLPQSSYPYGEIALDRALTDDEAKRFALVPATYAQGVTDMNPADYKGSLFPTTAHPSTGKSRTEPTPAADAKLRVIAAAPDLLAALQMARRVMPLGTGSAAEFMNMANAAITKATGKSHSEPTHDTVTSHVELVTALENLIKAFVNPGDGLPFEDGEVPALDEARAVLANATGSQAYRGPLADMPGADRAEDTQPTTQP